MVFDICVIGAGVIGALISRELSKYNLSVCIIEKEKEPAGGASKANSGIVHAGYDCRPGTLKAVLNVRGNALMEELAGQLDVPYIRSGSFVIAFDEYDLDKLSRLMDNGTKSGVPGLRIIGREEALNMEPAVSGDIVGALYAPTGAIICPYELTVAAVENAIENGVEAFFEFKAESIRFDDMNEIFEIKSEAGESAQCRYIVNAAGLYADRIASLIGAEGYALTPRKGEYILLDKNAGSMVKSIIFMTPTEKGKGVLVMPTVDGNLMLGPNSYFIDDKEDTATTAGGLEEVYRKATRSVPGINREQVINSFAGNRAASQSGDFIIKASESNCKFINLIGLDSPGLTCAPAIAEYVAELLQKCGLQMTRKTDFKSNREKVFRFRKADERERNAKIKSDPSFGKIVCRCEQVTEGEVVNCIRRPAGAKSLDGVKFRARAGMGRCSGGFCSPHLIRILARELGTDMTAVTKNRRGSEILTGRTKSSE